jgi:hypothetical protein
MNIIIEGINSIYEGKTDWELMARNEKCFDR